MGSPPMAALQQSSSAGQITRGVGEGGVAGWRRFGGQKRRQEATSPSVSAKSRLKGSIMPDPILLWNEVALEANRVSHTNGRNEQAGPPLSARALAIVHLAMYDAYAGVDTAAALPAYLAGLPTPDPASTVEAAVAAAAHTTLAALFPSQVAFFDAILAEAGDKANQGHDFGLAVARRILDDRKDDPGAGGPYTPSLERGRHRADPDNPGQGFHAP